jgi:hypothetical protein
MKRPESRAYSEQKLMTLALVEFLRRFLLHLLPKGFVRIRHFGLLANRRRSTLLPLCFAVRRQDRVLRSSDRIRGATMESQRVALYARVSTLAAQNPEMQLLELREYATRRAWQVVGEYVDHASGAKESRPALNRLMADARQRKFDVIAVWKVDRFGRSLKHLINALAELDAVGLAFVSLRDNLDFGTPSGRLMFQIIAAMAEFE